MYENIVQHRLYSTVYQVQLTESCLHYITVAAAVQEALLKKNPTVWNSYPQQKLNW